MTVPFDRAEVARHEAGHAAWEVLNGRLPLSVTIDWPETWVFGRVRLDLRHYGVNPETAPGMIIGIMLGPLAEGMAGWPLGWPLDPDPLDQDARQIAILAEYLELDEDGWDSLVRQAVTVSESEAFTDLVRLLSYGLERVEEVNQDQLRFLIGPDVCKRYGIPPATEEALCST